MKKIFLWSALAVAAAIAPGGAQAAPGMDAFDYYVGTWACVGGPTSFPPVKATFVGVMDAGLMRQTVSVPVQKGIKVPISQTMVVSYDGKGHYNQAPIENDGSWEVSQAPPWTGNTEIWTDLATADGKLGHGQTVRTDQNHFTFTGFGASGSTPVFTVTCQRQSS